MTSATSTHWHIWFSEVFLLEIPNMKSLLYRKITGDTSKIKYHVINSLKTMVELGKHITVGLQPFYSWKWGTVIIY